MKHEAVTLTALTRFRNVLERTLEIWVMFLISALTVIVVLAVIWRKAGASFVWYDEVGSIMLAWITAWTGWQVLQVLTGMNLISLPWVPIQITQSVIPIGAVLFIICEALSLPEYWRRLEEGIPADVVEVQEQMHVLEGDRT